MVAQQLPELCVKHLCELLSVRTMARRVDGTSKAVSVGAGAKRARVPDNVPSADADGPMTLLEASRMIRDLCRQYDKDRFAWADIVNAANDHADRIDALEHEALQVNDDMGLALDQQLNILKAYEERAQAQLVSVMADTQKAVGRSRRTWWRPWARPRRSSS